jgi:hypothetical protein
LKAIGRLAAPEGMSVDVLAAAFYTEILEETE